MSPRIRKCVLCGKEFEAPNGFVKRCPVPHFATCQVCGKAFPIDCEPNQIPKTCSEECRRIAIVRKRDKTVKSRYGVDNVSHLDSVKKKLSETPSSTSRQQSSQTTYSDSEVLTSCLTQTLEKHI